MVLLLIPLEQLIKALLFQQSLQCRHSFSMERLQLVRLHVRRKIGLDHLEHNIDFVLHEDALLMLFVPSGIFLEHSNAEWGVGPVDLTAENMPKV